MAPLLEPLAPAVLGGFDGPTLVGWVITVALIVTVAVVVFLALGPGTQPYQGEQAEPTPTDDAGAHDTDADGRSDTPTESGSD